MSGLAQGAAVILGLWLVASICYTFRVPLVFPFVRRLARLRIVASWSMFSATATLREEGFYRLEYRDHGATQPEGPWTAATVSRRAHPAGFLLDVRRPAADALDQLGRRLDSQLAPASGLAARTSPFYESMLEAHLERIRPTPPGCRRDIRLIKDRGGRTEPRELVTRTFTARGRA